MRTLLHGEGARLEIIVGCMFSGKSEELIRRVKRAQIAHQSVQVFKPLLDDRYSRGHVVSHDGGKVDATGVRRPDEILDAMEPETRVVAVDEVQFFDERIVSVVQALVDAGVRVICAGLDQDFRGEPFGPVPVLLALAEDVTKLSAICVQCGGPASRTQRLIDGRPASYDDPVILVGSAEVYEARCRRCHVVLPPQQARGVRQTAQAATPGERAGRSRAG